MWVGYAFKKLQTLPNDVPVFSSNVQMGLSRETDKSLSFSYSLTRI